MVVPVLLGVSIVTFSMLLLIPGNPADVMLPPDTSASARAAYIHSYHLDDPIVVRFGSWLQHAAAGDLGVSISRGEPASTVALRALSYTGSLAAVALAFAVVGGLLLGAVVASLATAKGPGARRIGETLNTLAISMASLPTFWFGLLMLYLFAVQLRMFPVGGAGPIFGPDSLAARAPYIVLPAIVAGIHPMAVLSRYTRVLVLEVVQQDFVLTLRARGYPFVRVLSHVLRNVLPGLVNVVGLQAGNLVLGTLFAEQVFSWPGIGVAITDAIAARDYPVIQAIVLFTGLLFTAITVLVDVVMQILDPRLGSA